MKFFNYGKDEMSFLSGSDKTLSLLIEKYGKIEWQLDDDVFSSIVHQIVAQEVSNKVQDVIWKRIRTLLKEDVSPRNILSLSFDMLRSTGISSKKTENILSIASVFYKEDISNSYFDSLNDDEAIKELVKFKGIGKWTAEMVLIFSLERKNILSLGDYGIRKGIKILYGKELEENYDYFFRLFSPFSTIASFYLWRVANESN